MRKPLHKHIGQGIKKAGSRLTKYLYERDTLFATTWVFIFIVVLGSIPLNLGIMNPLKLGLKDFDFNDIYYQKKIGKIQKTDIDTKHIVIVNIGNADREGIAMLIEKTASMQPKVIGLDVLFAGEKDPIQDSILRSVIQHNNNVVLAVRYDVDSSHKLVATGNYFKNDSSLSGYVNFPTFGNKETVRYYYPFKKDEEDHDLVLPSFTSTLLKKYDSTAYNRIKDKIDKKVIINYSRTVTEDKKQYLVVEPDALMTGNVDSSFFKDKIALLAYVNTNPNDIEDKKFTPMNEKYAGKSIPDVNGIIIHANILSMVLEDNFIKKLPSWANLLIAVVICWLHMSFFIHYYLESHIWFHLAAKLAQVLSAIFFVWLGIYIFSTFHLKVDLKFSLLTIIMAVDVIYFYEAWAVWMHKKYNYRTVFKPHHH